MQIPLLHHRQFPQHGTVAVVTVVMTSIQTLINHNVQFSTSCCQMRVSDSAGKSRSRKTEMHLPDPVEQR